MHHQVTARWNASIRKTLCKGSSGDRIDNVNQLPSSVVIPSEDVIHFLTSTAADEWIPSFDGMTNILI
jgi:hypothetical protein